MTFAQLNALAEWHEVEARDHLENADLFGDDPAGAELRAAGEQHAEWAAQLRSLLAPELVTNLSLDAARDGLAMSAKVIAAMESERLQLCTEICQLRTEATKT